jgi:hypothetical protein
MKALILSKLIFGGVEIPSNRTTLERQNVKNVMLNYWGLKRRGLPKTKPYLIEEHFNSDMKVWVDSGAVQADKASLSLRELEEYAADYEEFIVNNYDRIEGWTELDSQVMGLQWILHQRAAKDNDDKLWVVWHESYGTSTLREWAKEYRNIAISGEAIESVTNLASVTRSLKATNDVNFHALATAKPDNLRQIPFETASTLAWLSPMRRGETIIWDGQKLVRYPKGMKDQARLRYKSIVEKAGLNFEEFVSDTNLVSTKVAIWSYLELEKTMSKSNNHPYKPSDQSLLSDRSDDTLYTGLMETGIGGSNNKGDGMRKLERNEVIKRDPKDVMPMPVFGYEIKTIIETEGGQDVLKDVPVVKSNSATIRQCDTCFVAANCPAFQPATMCAFSLPVEVKTKEQLKALLTSIVEMQGQRVAFMRYAEELNGGYADPNTSQEMDRLLKLVSSVKDLETNKEVITMTASRQTSGGILSSIFGDRATELKEMQRPLSEEQTTFIISDSLEK